MTCSSPAFLSCCSSSLCLPFPLLPVFAPAVGPACLVSPGLACLALPSGLSSRLSLSRPPACWILSQLLFLASSLVVFFIFSLSLAPPSPVPVLPPLSFFSSSGFYFYDFTFPILFFCLLIIHCCIFCRSQSPGNRIRVN